MDTGSIVANLLALQRPDGGWSYGAGSSWTEPTAMALLALVSHRVKDAGISRGLNWLERTQRSDGGWAPHPGVKQTTWVTSLAVLLPVVPDSRRRSGVRWLLDVSGRESGMVERLRSYLSGSRPEFPSVTVGWPWFPGTAGWVTPTVMAMLALGRYSREHDCTDRIASGKEFLIARVCPDGGWNHGNSRAVGYDLTSYPETTGQVLLALKGSSWNRRTDAIRCASEHLQRAASVEAAVWLQLGLLAHGQQVSDVIPDPSGVMNLSLALIAKAARQGVNAFEL